VSAERTSIAALDPKDGLPDWRDVQRLYRAVIHLQLTTDAQRVEIDTLKRRVSYLEGAHQP
jgi:hypothetical protein